MSIAEAGKSSAVVEADNMRRMVRVETFRKFVEQVTARSAASLGVSLRSQHWVVFF